MGIPLGQALVNILVGFYESKLFRSTRKSPVYFRYVDDIFAIFKKKSDCNVFHQKLNALHPSLKFSFEKEQNNSLPFLEVFVKGNSTGFLTSIYRSQPLAASICVENP